MDKEELEKAYAAWGDDVKVIMKHVQTPSKWSMHIVNPPLEHYVRDRVVLVGDAVGLVFDPTQISQC